MSAKKIRDDVKKALKWLNESDSILADFIWLIIFYIIIRFVIFPLLGFFLHTSYPLVAIVSTSMQHEMPFDQWWNSKPCNACLVQKEWYEKHNITKEQFLQFPWPNGLNKGDVMILYGKKPEEIKVGDILVFTTPSGKAVIHRVIKKWQENGTWYFQTKGDRNPDSSGSIFILETRIRQDRVLGVAIFRIPWLGWPKAWLQDMMQ